MFRLPIYNYNSMNYPRDKIEWIIVDDSDENRIAVVSHSSFIGKHLYDCIYDESNELKHCHPYGPYEYAKL